MAVNLAAEQALLLPGLFKVEGLYKEIPSVHKSIFTVRKSQMALERAVTMRYVGNAQIKSEGGPTAPDNNMGQRYVWNITHSEVGLMYSITRKAIEDNLYKDEFTPTNLGLNKAFAVFKETLAANVFNNGQTADSVLVGDGVSLFATTHPFDGNLTGTTWANTFTTAQSLNESSLFNAQTNIRTNFFDEAGLKIRARAKKLLIPPQLEAVARRLLKADLRPGTAQNEPNILTEVHGATLSSDYITWDYLTSAFAWFVLTDVDGLIHFERIPYEMDMQVDFTSDNLLVKAYERYSFNYIDPKASYGTFPLS
jgi:phage major head subunit gpT-like protein